MNISKLNNLLKQRKINNSNLALSSGLSDVTISKILNGADAKISSIEKIARALEVSVGYFFDESTSAQNSTGNSNVMVGRDNHGSISTAECQDKLDDALLEIKHLKEVVDGKDKLLKEKERFVETILSFQKNGIEPIIDIYTNDGKKRINILQINNIIPSTGKETEFYNKINSGDGREYPCCMIYMRDEILFALQDSAYIWSLITGRLEIALK